MPALCSSSDLLESVGHRLPAGGLSRPALLLLLVREHLRHAEPDAQPHALERRATAAALGHALAGPHHRLRLGVVLEPAREPAVGDVLGELLEGGFVLFLDADVEVAEPDICTP